MQSSSAVGYGRAEIVAYLVLPLAGWRGVFFVGLMPALLTVWVRRRVPESQARRAQIQQPASETRVGLGALFRGALLPAQ